MAAALLVIFIGLAMVFSATPSAEMNPAGDDGPGSGDTPAARRRAAVAEHRVTGDGAAPSPDMTSRPTASARSHLGARPRHPAAALGDHARGAAPRPSSRDERRARSSRCSGPRRHGRGGAAFALGGRPAGQAVEALSDRPTPPRRCRRPRAALGSRRRSGLGRPRRSTTRRPCGGGGHSRVRRSEVGALDQAARTRPPGPPGGGRPPLTGALRSGSAGAPPPTGPLANRHASGSRQHHPAPTGPTAGNGVEAGAAWNRAQASPRARGR
jgi:hypothetical protein